MLEQRKDKLLPLSKFIIRMLHAIVWGLLSIAVALFIGMLGYHYFEHMSWVDAFANASMILSGMGPLTPLNTIGGKIFAGLYALFSGLAFILCIGIIFTPIVHRLYHKFHIES